jgi:hypothetical protein
MANLTVGQATLPSTTPPIATTVPIGSTTTPSIQATLSASISPLEGSNRLGSFDYGIFSLRWTNLNDSTDFVFTYQTTTPDNVWGAFAFSKDQRMVFKKKKTQTIAATTTITKIEKIIN